MLEIERKFLVINHDFKNETQIIRRIAQGYISTDPERIVRIRIKDNQGYITIKGKSNESGLSRFEWEKEIELQEAESLIQLCRSGIIDKSRFEVKFGDHLFEVDEFYGDNEGLIVAEVELNSEDEFFEKPKWLGKEVTSDSRYSNSYLSKKPFKSW